MLSTARFHRVIEDTPLISLDLVVMDDQNRMLLGKRLNAPADGFWFVPGGRIHKSELLDAAMRRLLISELGIKAAERLQPKWLGLYEHHYTDSVVGPDVSTHYVVLAHQVNWPADLAQALPTEQHDAYRWQCISEVAVAVDVHVYTRWYAQDFMGVKRCLHCYP